MRSLKFIAALFCANLFSTSAHAQILKCDGKDMYGKDFVHTLAIDGKNKKFTFNGFEKVKVVLWNSEVIQGEYETKLLSLPTKHTIYVNRITGQFVYSRVSDILSATEQDIETINKSGGTRDVAQAGECVIAKQRF